MRLPLKFILTIARFLNRARRGRGFQPDSTRLYAAGEITSIFGHLYLEAGNIAECFVGGRIAGKNAAAEKAWS